MKFKEPAIERPSFIQACVEMEDGAEVPLVETYVCEGPMILGRDEIRKLENGEEILARLYKKKH